MGKILRLRPFLLIDLSFEASNKNQRREPFSFRSCKPTKLFDLGKEKLIHHGFLPTLHEILYDSDNSHWPEHILQAEESEQKKPLYWKEKGGWVFWMVALAGGSWTKQSTIYIITVEGYFFVRMQIFVQFATRIGSKHQNRNTMQPMPSKPN